jgi:hypothetical protein
MNGLKQFQTAFKKERREHPSLPVWAVRQIVKDHAKKR